VRGRGERICRFSEHARCEGRKTGRGRDESEREREKWMEKECAFCVCARFMDQKATCYVFFSFHTESQPAATQEPQLLPLFRLRDGAPSALKIIIKNRKEIQQQEKRCTAAHARCRAPVPFSLSVIVHRVHPRKGSSRPRHGAQRSACRGRVRRVAERTVRRELTGGARPRAGRGTDLRRWARRVRAVSFALTGGYWTRGTASEAAGRCWGIATGAWARPSRRRARWVGLVVRGWGPAACSRGRERSLDWAPRAGFFGRVEKPILSPVIKREAWAFVTWAVG
jgi:hypothetical protein